MATSLADDPFAARTGIQEQAKSPRPMVFGKSPHSPAFRLMSPPPRGKVHMATDNAHYEDLND
jgi:hypothetical protein